MSWVSACSECLAACKHFSWLPMSPRPLLQQITGNSAVDTVVGGQGRGERGASCGRVL